MAAMAPAQWKKLLVSENCMGVRWPSFRTVLIQLLRKCIDSSTPANMTHSSGVVTRRPGLNSSR